jgi:hypothetical protein
MKEMPHKFGDVVKCNNCGKDIVLIDEIQDYDYYDSEFTGEQEIISFMTGIWEHVDTKERGCTKDGCGAFPIDGKNWWDIK